MTFNRVAEYVITMLQDIKNKEINNVKGIGMTRKQDGTLNSSPTMEMVASVMRSVCHHGSSSIIDTNTWQINTMIVFFVNI